MSKFISVAVRVLIFLLICLLCPYGVLLSGSKAFAESPGGATDIPVIVQKSITRQPDPIVITGAKLPSLAGLKPGLIGLYALHNNILTPIPFQIDSKDEENKYILTDIGSDAKLPTPDFDANDEVAFMAKDLGDRCPAALYPQGYRKAVEIEVTDPIDKSKGWSYLFAFDKPAPQSQATYTRYLYPQTGEDKVDTNVFIMGFPPVETYRAHSCNELIVTPAAGGSGENFLDRLKTRVSFKFIFSFFKLNFSEEMTRSELLAYKDGPVHIFRRSKLFIPLGFGLKSPGFVTDMYFYETVMSAPMDFTIPFRFGSVLSSVTMRIGFDYLPCVKGSTFYNSLNQKGFLVDGKPTPDEEEMDHGESVWNLITGPQGTTMRRNLKYGLAHKYFEMGEYIWDNEADLDPPETHPGNIGHTYQLWDVTNLPRGEYKLDQYFFVLPNFKWGDQFEYLKINDTPLEVIINDLS